MITINKVPSLLKGYLSFCCKKLFVTRYKFEQVSSHYFNATIVQLEQKLALSSIKCQSILTYNDISKPVCPLLFPNKAHHNNKPTII